MNITPPPLQNTYTDNPQTEEEREYNRKYHRTRAIVYGALWLMGGIVCFFSGVLGALIGSLFGTAGAVYGAMIFLGIGIISVGAFFILAIYHLIKWLNV